MNNSVNISRWKAALSLVAPLLKGMLGQPAVLTLECDGLSLKMRVVNSDSEIRVEVACEGVAFGPITVLANPLLEMSKTLEADLELSACAKTLILRSGEFNTKMSLLTRTQLPTLPVAQDWVEVEPARLKWALERVSSIQGANFPVVQLEGKAGQCFVSATDGLRLARATLAVPIPDGCFHLPMMAIPTVSRVLGRLETASIALTKGWFFLRGNGAYYATVQSGQELPDLSTVLSRVRTANHTIKADAAKFASALARCAAFSSNDTHRVDLHFADNDLRLSVEGEYGNTSDHLEVQGSYMAPKAHSFNARLLQDSLEQLDGLVSIEARNITQPWSLRTESLDIHLAPLRAD